MKSLLPNHVISGNVDDFPEICSPYTEILRDRSMLVKKAKPLPIECVVRGYISGSGWKRLPDHQKHLRNKTALTGLKESDKLYRTPCLHLPPRKR